VLIDEFMTRWDIVKRHEIQVNASPIDTLAELDRWTWAPIG
jgi:hypothetical protein